MRAVAAPRPDAPPVTRNMLFRICIGNSAVNSPIILTACNSVSAFVSTTYTSAKACCASTRRSSISSARSTPRCATAGRGARHPPFEAKDESDLLVALAPHVEDFLARLFGIEAEARALAERHNELAPLYSVKRLFVQRRALHKVKPEDARPDGFQVHHRARLRAAGDRVAQGRSRRTRRSWKPLRATPRGRRSRPRARQSTAAACCSRRRASSTS